MRQLETAVRRILIISSYVAHGTVGLQATLPALMRPDFEVTAMPTVILSNHPGHRKCAGTTIATETLAAMLDALDGNGWLTKLDAVFTGYLPSVAHVEWALHTIEHVKALNPKVFVTADPVLGDDPGGLYVGHDTAAAVRDRLLRVADLTTPNRFELAWLTGSPVTDCVSAVSAARSLGTPLVAATSIPDGNETIANLLITPGHWIAERLVRRPHAPHGTGDYFAGLLLAGLLEAQPHNQALRAATTGVARAIDASNEGNQLRFDSREG
jgi:pyridoxine kinase